jgi:hypothetical protein
VVIYEKMYLNIMSAEYIVSFWKCMSFLILMGCYSALRRMIVTADKLGSPARRVRCLLRNCYLESYIAIEKCLEKFTIDCYIA